MTYRFGHYVTDGEFGPFLDWHTKEFYMCSGCGYKSENKEAVQNHITICERGSPLQFAIANMNKDLIESFNRQKPQLWRM